MYAVLLILVFNQSFCMKECSLTGSNLTNKPRGGLSSSIIPMHLLTQLIIYAVLLILVFNQSFCMKECSLTGSNLTNKPRGGFFIFYNTMHFLQMSLEVVFSAVFRIAAFLGGNKKLASLMSYADK